VGTHTEWGGWLGGRSTREEGDEKTGALQKKPTPVPQKRGQNRGTSQKKNSREWAIQIAKTLKGKNNILGPKRNPKGSKVNVKFGGQRCGGGNSGIRKTFNLKKRKKEPGNPHNPVSF